jgi:hypothetical protein
MRRNRIVGLGVLLFVATLCAASPAAGANGVHLAGGASTAGGVFVQLNVRADPGLGNPAPATGANQISLGGRLNSAITTGGVTAPDFVLLITTDGREVKNVFASPANLTLLPDCGLPLFFSSPPLQGRPENEVVRGHISAQ